MTKIAICDDEELIRTQLYNLLSDYLEKRNISAEILTYSSGNELLEKIQTIELSCLFMDIDLKENINGIETVKKIRQYQKKTMIVFVTSFAEYANKVLSLHTFDYVTKPYKNSEINKVLDDLFYWLKDNEHDQEIKIQFKTIDGLISLNIANILYFEYKDRRIDIVTEKEKYHMYGKIRDVYAKVKDYGFAVPHISYVVNMHEIKKMIKSEYKIVMINEQDIPISQLKLKDFKHTYTDFLKKLEE